MSNDKLPFPLLTASSTSPEMEGHRMDRPIELFVDGNPIDFVQSNAITFVLDGEDICEICSCAVPSTGDVIELVTKIGQQIRARVCWVEWDVLESCNSFGARIYLDRPARSSECPLPSLRGGVENLFFQYPPIDVIEQLSQSLSRFRDVPCEVIDLLDRAARVLEGYQEDEAIEAETLTINRRQRQWLENQLDEELLFFHQLDDRTDDESMLTDDLERLRKALTSEIRSHRGQEISRYV